MIQKQIDSYTFNRIVSSRKRKTNHVFSKALWEDIIENDIVSLTNNQRQVTVRVTEALHMQKFSYIEVTK